MRGPLTIQGMVMSSGMVVPCVLSCPPWSDVMMISVPSYMLLSFIASSSSPNESSSFLYSRNCCFDIQPYSCPARSPSGKCMSMSPNPSRICTIAMFSMVVMSLTLSVVSMKPKKSVLPGSVI